MRLVIDVGNTSINCGLWSKKTLVRKFFLPTDNFKKFSVNKKNLSEIIYASVVPIVDNFFKKYFRDCRFYKLDYRQIPYLKIALPNKKEIGIDRLVNAAGAVKLYKPPLIIIDLGTATTFCLVDKNLVYQGGLICPGINLTRLVLHEKTAKLPLVQIALPRKLIGKSTTEAMQAGIYYGYQSLIEGILGKLKKHLGPGYKTIATGGYAELICKNLEQKIEVIDPNLTLKSLNLIGDYLINAHRN